MRPISVPTISFCFRVMLGLLLSELLSKYLDFSGTNLPTELQPPICDCIFWQPPLRDNASGP